MALYIDMNLDQPDTIDRGTIVSLLHGEWMHLIYEGEDYYVYDSSHDETPSMCGGTEYRLTIERTPREFTLYCHNMAWARSFNAGITLSVIECADTKLLIAISELLNERVVNRTANVSGAWAVTKGALYVLSHFAEATCSYGVEDEDSGIDVDDPPTWPYTWQGDHATERPLYNVQYLNYWESPYHEGRIKDRPCIGSYLIQQTGIKPAFVSSNVGAGREHTADILADIRIKKARLRDEYGLTVLAPYGLATNPNEGHHYIDSVLVVNGVIDTGEFSSTYWENHYDADEDCYDECW